MQCFFPFVVSGQNSMATDSRDTLSNRPLSNLEIE